MPYENMAFFFKIINKNFNNIYLGAKMNRIIFFSKAPNLINSKTRLEKFLNENERLELMRKLIKQNYKLVEDKNFSSIIYYDGDLSNIAFLEGQKTPQSGNDLGEKMKNAIYNELDIYSKVALFGSDLENLSKNHIEEAFKKLDNFDIVIAPSKEGGYGLVARKEKIDIFTNIKYSTPFVLEDTIKQINKLDKTYYLLDPIRDIDTISDLIIAEFDNDNVTDLGHGEYNLNYRLNNEVIRINLASQIGLGEKQLKYEYDALKVLEKSGVTPRPYKFYEKGKFLPKSFMTMEYVEGRSLNYKSDMDIAAKLLSSVHNLRGEYDNFICAKKPFQSMFDEFVSMFSYYQSYENKDLEVEAKINKFLNIAKSSDLDAEIKKPCIINTELNNRNFIIGKHPVIIDWEKPIIGECEQDLAHFLVPTTTNWKTDTILTEEEMLLFLKVYEQYRKVDYDKLYKYLMFNSLRGVTWCSMAKVEYEEGRFISNDDTLAKINKFLSIDFLKMLEKFYRI